MSSEIPYFDRVAENWDEIRATMFGEEVREAAMRRAGLTPDLVAADVGTGTGFIAEAVAPLVRRVYALDASAAMLAAAQRKLQRFDNTELRLIAGDNLSLENDSIDVVFANMYLHHASNPLAAIREMIRVLKPGGQLVITDADKHEHEWMRREMADVWLGFD